MKKLLVVSLFVLCVANPVLAKMVDPQGPDRDGWDICFNHNILGDAWKCAESGPVAEIRFWGSWQDDAVDWYAIEKTTVRIYSDHSAGFFHAPKDLLWERQLGFTIGEQVLHGNQSFYCPCQNFAVSYDHKDYYQLSFEDIQDPFEQELGYIYWLEIEIDVSCTDPPVFFGWKTTPPGNVHYGPAYWKCKDCGGGGWLKDPTVFPPAEEVDLDLAFAIIIPEPATICLLGLGGLALRLRLGQALRRKRRA